jgi:hypothetical protein
MGDSGGALARTIVTKRPRSSVDFPSIDSDARRAWLSDLIKVVERTHTQAMEQLQEAYVCAVASAAGALVDRVDRDMHKYDVELIRQPHIDQEEVSVRLQLKATTTIRPKPGATDLSFKFKSRADYASLAMPRTVVKHLLVVMVVGTDQRRWADAQHTSLSVQHCCYWLSMEGMSTKDLPDSPTVKIPMANVFDSRALSDILDRVEGGGQP